MEADGENALRRSAHARRFPLLAIAVTLLATARPASAQREGYTHLSYAGPEVSLVSPADQEGAARPGMPVLAGDLLVTGDDSRAEAVLSDGNVVRLDGGSELRFESLNRTYEADDDRTVLGLARGTAAVEVHEVSTRDRALRLDTDDATILSAARSLFRVETGSRGTDVYVLAGRVEVNGQGGRALVRAGEYAHVRGDDEIEVETGGPARDRFAAFVDERRGRAERPGGTRWAVAEDSPDADAVDAAGLDDAGTWTYVTTAGATCWRPSVPADWTPYSLGNWRRTPAGLTWFSYEPWGWLPYHYGRWAWEADLGWYWVPGHAYAPAWVTWGNTREWTGWCPAGWTGRRAASRGWNFVATSRLGSRLGALDVKRGDRMAFPRGETVVVTPAPPPVERGAVRSVETTRTAQIDATRRAGRGEVWRAGGARGIRVTPRAGKAPADQGWRAASSLPPAPIVRRAGEHRDRQADTGWRAPSPRIVERPAPQHTAPPPPAAPPWAPAASRRDG
jgi:hypothetical protein